MANMIYMAYDGDNAGRLVGQAVLANDEAALSEVSSRIALGHEVVQSWVQEQGGKVISGGGDEGTFAIPADALNNIEQLRSDYQFTTQLTMTVGAGASLSEAGKALMAGKFRGKDMVVQYDPSVDQDIAAAQDRIAQGTGSAEENKLGEAYLGAQQAAPATDRPPSPIDHAADCKYCQETPDHSHTDDCQYCQASEVAAPDHDHTDDCQYCAQAEAADHSHTDDCQYCAAKEQVDSHEHNDEDCQWCLTAEQRAADADHDHTDDCQYCAAKEAPVAQATGQELAGDITANTNSEQNASQIAGIDDTQMPVGTESEGGVSHPDGYDDGDGGGLTNVLQGGLDEQADSINKEKIVGLVSQALQGFKANKQILEKAKEQAPDLYSSTILMLKAMIEMAKQLGFGQEVAQAEQEPVQPQEAQPAAPQEGAGGPPQQ